MTNKANDMTITKNTTFTCATDSAMTYTFTGKTKEPTGGEYYKKYQFTESSKYGKNKIVWRNTGWIKEHFTTI